MNKEYFKFEFGGELFYLVAESDTLALVSEDGWVVSEFFLVSEFEKILQGATKLLKRLEDRGSSITTVREMLDNYIERESFKIALQSLTF